MYQERRCTQRVFGRRWAAVVARRRLVPITAVMLAAAACVALAPRALSSAAAVPAGSASAVIPTAAPNTEGINWVPIGVSQNNDDGNCWVEIDGDVEGQSATPTQAFSQVQAALAALPPKAVNQDGISSITMSEPAGGGDSVDQPITARAGVDCSFINQADDYFRKAGVGSLAQGVQATLDSYLRSAHASGIVRAGTHAIPAAYDGVPAWLKGAIAAIAAAATCLAVEAAVVAGMVALGVAAGPFAVVSTPALAALAGCLGAAAGVAVASVVSTGQLTPATVIGPIIYGCVIGAATAALSAVVIRRWLSSVLAQALGIPEPVEAATPNFAQAEGIEIEMSVLGSEGSADLAASDTSFTTSAADMTNEFVDELVPR